ncbi:unnamed protein product [Caenorhabditis brenneri]
MSYRQDCENITNDLKEFQAREDARRKEQLEKVEQQMKTNMEQLAELRKFESERQAAEEARHEKSLKAIADRTRKTYESNLDRQDRRLQENTKKEEESIENLNKTLEKQKEFLSTEIKNKTQSQLEKMQRMEQKMKEETEKAASKVVALNQDRLTQQKKLSDDLKQYHKDHQKTLQRHQDEVEEMTDEQNKLLVKREQEAIQATERLKLQEQEFKGHGIKVIEAASSDQTERNFINAVLNTKTAGREATSAVSQLGDNAYRLRKGQPANAIIVNALKNAITVDVSSKLEELRICASSVTEQQETKNEKATECHKAARAIDDAIITLQKSLRKFRGSLEDEIIEESVDLYKKVEKACKDLGIAVTSMPAVSRSNHAITQILNYTEEIVIRTSSSELPKPKKKE